MVLQVELLVTSVEDEDKFIWVDFWMDVSAIIGFRLSKEEHTSENDRGIWVYTLGDVFLLKDEPNLQKYLVNKFIKRNEVI